MMDLSKYQNNPATEPVGTGESISIGLERSFIRIEEVLGKRNTQTRINPLNLLHAKQRPKGKFPVLIKATALVILLFLVSSYAFAQTPGLIIKPASFPGNSILDPDLDGYVSQKTNGIQLGFTIPPFNDVSQSEIPYVALIRPDPLGDLLRGPVGAYPEIVGIDAAGNSAILTYNDGTNLLFRFRLGGYAPNSKSYSLLIDTDGKFGFTGLNADPNAVPGNPGFEVEIVLETGFNVKVFNVDGAATLPGSAAATYGFDTNCQQSAAVTTAGGDPDYFYDFYVPLSAFTTLTPAFTSSTPIRVVAVTVMNPNGAIGSNSLSDVGGVGSITGSVDQAFVNLIDAQTPTVPGSEVLDRTTCPMITGSYTAASTVVSGTSTEANGTVIQVYINGSPAGATVTVSGGIWSRSGLTLAATNIITATATAPGKGTSFANCSSKTVTAAACATAAPTSISFANSGKVTINFAAASSGTTITVYNADFTTWKSGSATTGSTSLQLTGGNPSTGNGKVPGGTYYATVTYNSCESTRIVACNPGTTPAAPTITPPIAVGATSVSGTGGVVGDYIIVYADGVQIAQTSVAATSWSVTVPALTNCQQITADQGRLSVNGSTDTGVCSAISTTVSVSHTAVKPTINSTGCAANPVTISGSSIEADGTVVTLYNTNPSRVSLGTATVASGGWSVSGLTLTSGNILVAAVTSGACLTASVDSNPVTISTQTSLTGYTIAVTAPTEGQTSVSGTITGGSYPVTLKIYEDETLVGSGVSIASAGAWTVSSGFLSTDLYVGGKLKVTLTSATGCESLLSAELVTVQCISPAMPAYTGGSKSYCYGGAGQLALTTSEVGVIYQLVDGSGQSQGAAFAGIGGVITLYTNQLISNLLNIYVKAYKVGSSSCSTTSTTAINFDTQLSSPSVTFTSTILSVAKGTTSVNLLYSAKSVSAVNYTIDYPSSVNSLGFTDITTPTAIPASPIVLTVPSNPAIGTYPGTITIHQASGCTASYSFTITVYGASSPPIISAQPISKTICSGTTALSVTASGSGSLTYQWQSATTYSGAYSNVVGGIGGTTASYTTASLAATTYYKVIVTNASGSVTSNIATVTVTVAPSAAGSITGNSTVCAGQTGAAFSIAAIANANSYTWSYSGTGATFSGTTVSINVNFASNATSGTLSVAGTNVCGSGGAATMVITVNPANTAGTASSTPTLCINTALTAITITTTGATGISNSGVSGANSLPAGVSATWASNTITISGTPSASGAFNYSIPLTGGCGSVNATGTIIVTAANTAGSPSTSPTLCINTALTAITITTTGATGISNSGVSGANSLPAGVSATWASNTITISGTPTASGTFNYSIPLTGGCGSVSATGTITVSPASVGGTIAGSATVCSGINSIALTLSGQTGNVTKWQSSSASDFSVSLTDIANTTTSLTATNLTVTTYYRAVVTSGACSSANSATATITVNSVTGGSVGSDQNISSNTTPAAFTQTGAATGSGTLTYQWQSSVTSISTGFSNIIGATATIYTETGLLTLTTYYKRITTSTLSGVICTAESNVITVAVGACDNPSISVQPSSPSAVCDGAGIATISVTAAGTLLTYQWYVDGLTPLSNIAPYSGVTSATLTITNPSVSLNGKLYTVIVSGFCGSPVTSSNATLTVNTLPLAPTGTSAQSFCSGTSPTVASLSATGTGILWYAASSGGSSLATSTALVNGTHYYASQTVSGCESTSRFDVTATVNTTPSTPTGTAAQSFCSGTSPTVASLSATGTGILWYAASSGGSSLAISTALVNGTHYYASQTVSGCASSRFDVTATVNTTPAAPTGTAAQSFCSGASPTVANLSATGSGILWYAASGGGSSLATSTALANGTHYYASQTVSGCESTSRFDVTATVNAVSGGTIGTNQTISPGGDPAAFTSTVDGTGNGTITIQWQSSPDNMTFSVIGGAAGTTYDPPSGLAATTYYKRITTSTLSGFSCTAESNTVIVTLNNPAACSFNFADNFGANVYSNSDGSQAFSTDWIESGDDYLNSPTLDNVQVNSGSLRMGYQGIGAGNKTYTLTRSAVLTNISSVTVTFPYTKIGSDPQDSYTLRLLVNGTAKGSIITVSGTPAVSGTYSVTLNNSADYTSGTTTFALQLASTKCGSYLAIDNFNIAFSFNLTSTTINSTTNVNCYGGSNGAITINAASGGSGTYQYSVNGGTSWQSGTSFTGLTAGNYIVKVRDANYTGCEYTIDASRAITQPATLTAGISGGSSPICYNTAPGTFTATGGGGIGSYTYLWYKNGSTTGITTQTYDPGALTVTSTFYCAITSGSCGTVNTSTTTITVSPASVGGTIAGSATICSGSTSGLLTLSGHTGTVTKWQYSTDGSNWTDIVNTLTTYTSGALTQTTQFRAVVTSGACSSANSATATITVNSVTGGSVGSDQNISSNTTPAAFTETGAATGSGPLTWQWQSSVTSISSGFSDINGATGTTYAETGLLTLTTYYKRITTSTLNTVSCTAESNVITVTVGDCVPPLISVEPSSPSAVCDGAGIATMSVTATGTSLNYQWYVDGSTPLSNVAPYSGVTLATLTITNPPVSLNGKIYKVIVSESCGSPVTSSNATLTVNTIPSAPTGTSAQSFCSGTSPTVASLSATGTGILWYAASSGGSSLATSTALVNGTHYYASQTVSVCESTSRFDVTATVNTTPAAPTGTAAQSFCSGASPTVANLSATGTGILWYAASSGGSSLATSTALVNSTHYYASQTVSGCESTSRLDVTATVNAVSGGTIGTNQTISPGGDPAAFTQVTPSTGDGTLSYQWQSSTNNMTFGNIGGATSTTYDPPSGLAATTYYKRITTSTLSGVPCTAESNTIIVTVINPAACIFNFADNFGANVYSNSNGSQAFSTDWIESGDDYLNSPTSGNVQVNSGSLQMGYQGIGAGNKTYTLTRSAVLTNISSVTVTFPYIKIGSDSQDNYTLQLLVNGTAKGSTITVTGAGAVSGTFSVTLYNPADYTLGTTTFALQLASTKCVSYLAIDYFDIAFSFDLTSTTINSTTNVTCYGGSNGAITINAASGGSGTYQYSVNGGSNWQSGTSFTGLTAGNYIVKVRDANYTVCEYTIDDSKAITQPATLTAGISGGSSPICYNTAPGTFTATGGGGTGSYTYQWYNTSGIIGGATNSTYTPGNLTVTTGYFCAISSGTCGTVNTATTSVTVNPDGSWTGAQDTDWNNTLNWACHQLPTLTTNVLIANGKPRYPTLSTGSIGLCKDLSIESSSSVTVTGNTLQIAGTISNGGTFDATAGTIEMKGSDAQTIASVFSASNTILNLTVNNSAGVTLTGALNVTGIVKAAVGNLTSNGNLTLISTSGQTALIDGSGLGQVVGNVKMQRYIPVAFGYKYVSSPFQDATVGQFTSHLNPNASFPTFYKYNEDQLDGNGDDKVGGWVTYTNPASPLVPMTGYAANFGSVPRVELVDLNGTVNNGNNIGLTLYSHNLTYTKGFNLIGNPYPSPIDWNLVNLTGSAVDNAIYFFRASSPSSNVDGGAAAIENLDYQYLGQYRSYVNGVNTTGVEGDVANSNLIASMQGFLVHVNGTDIVETTLNFTNAIRTTDLTPALKTAPADDRSILRFSANYEIANAFEDDAVIYFEGGANQSFESDKDALKMLNTDPKVPNLYSFSLESKQLSINGMPILNDSTTEVPLGLNLLSDGFIIFKAKDISTLPFYLHLYLLDAEKAIIQDLQQNAEYRFNLKKGEYNQRFSLIFSQSEINDPAAITKNLFTIVRSTDYLLARVTLPYNTRGTFMVTSMSGQVVISQEVFGCQTIPIDLNVTSGLYIVTVISGNRAQSEKLLMRLNYE